MRHCKPERKARILKAARAFAMLLVSFFFILPISSAWAAMGQISSFSLLEDKTTDITGKETAIGQDGLMDAGFAVSIRGSGAITRVLLVNTTSGKRWDTSTSSGNPILTVRTEKGETLNSRGEMNLFAFVLGARLSLWVNDRDATLATDGTYEATVHFVDRSTAKATLNVKGIAAQAAVTLPAAIATAPAQAGATAAVITSATYQGQKNEDFAGPSTTGKKIGKSGKNDWVTEVKLNAVGTITGFKLRNTSGPAGAWDTFPDSGTPLIAVASDGSVTLPKIFNKDDGSVSIPINGAMTFYLLTEDNGSLEDRRTATVLSVHMGDKVSEAVVARNLPERGTSFDVISFDYSGRGRYDFVSGSPKLESNFTPDIGFTAALAARGTISGVRITGSWDDSAGKKVSKIWDTVPSNTNPLIAVTRADGRLLNKNDSTVSIPVNGRDTLYFWIDNEAEIGGNPNFRADIAFSDGRILTPTWSKTTTTAATPPASGAAAAQTRTIRLTAKPAPLQTGVVGKTEAPASGSKNNTSLIVRLRGSGTITRMSIVNQSGAGSWDTTPGNKIPLLGVRQQSKLQNAKDGTIRIAVKNTADLELVAEDNGSIKKRGSSRFLLSIGWSDGTITKELLSW